MIDRTTIRVKNDIKIKASELMNHYGLSFSGLVRFLICRAWEEIKK